MTNTNSARILSTRRKKKRTPEPPSEHRKPRAIRPTAHSLRVQALLKLPGFRWTQASSSSTSPTVEVFSSAESHIWIALGAMNAENKKLLATNQNNVATRVADVLETCYDVYYDKNRDFGGQPLSEQYWEAVHGVLMTSLMWWTSQDQQKFTAYAVYQVAMAYLMAWDERGADGEFVRVQAEGISWEMRSRPELYLRV